MIKVINQDIQLNIIFVFICLIPISLLIGPAIADIILSATSILFLFYAYSTNKLKNFFFNYYFLIAFLFYIYLILSSLLSNYQAESLLRSIPFIRFIIFIVAMRYIINSKNFHIIIQIIITISLVLSIDIIYQFYAGKDIFGYEYEYWRASGFFGEKLIAGHFLSKLFIVLLVFLPNIFYQNFIYKNIFFSCLLIFCLFIIVITGERSSLLLFIFGLIMLFVLQFKDYFLSIIFNIIFFISATLYITTYLPRFMYWRYIDNATLNLNSFYTFEIEKIIPVHAKYINTAFDLFLSSPIYGTGYRNFRYACQSLETISSDKYLCSTHPHNYILEIISDLGMIGILFLLMFFILMFKLIIQFAYNHGLFKLTIYQKTFLIIILIFFFPFQFSMSIFTNWNAVFLSFIIGCYLATFKKKL